MKREATWFKGPEDAEQAMRDRERTLSQAERMAEYVEFLNSWGWNERRLTRVAEFIELPRS